jgi:hypothetical protein
MSEMLSHQLQHGGAFATSNGRFTSNWVTKNYIVKHVSEGINALENTYTCSTMQVDQLCTPLQSG